MAADPNHVILTGENPFIRLSATDGGPQTTNASYWRIITCPAGPGHVLYLKSELTENNWRIYSDNIAMARWLQGTVQGMLNAETADTSIPVIDAEFSKSGDPRYFWTEDPGHARRGDQPDLVRYRRAAADPHQPRRGRPQIRRLHAADPGARREAHPQRRRGCRETLAAAARRPPVQHLRARLLGKLDRGEVAASGAAPSAAKLGSTGRSRPGGVREVPAMNPRTVRRATASPLSRAMRSGKKSP